MCNSFLLGHKTTTDNLLVSSASHDLQASCGRDKALLLKPLRRPRNVPPLFPVSCLDSTFSLQHHNKNIFTVIRGSFSF